MFFYSILLLGYSQAVRQGTLTPHALVRIQLPQSMVSGALAPSMLIIVFAGTLKNILLSRVRIGWLLLEDFFRMNEFEELLNSVSEVSTGDVVTAEVISVDNDQANVVIEGTGIEGVLTRRELTNDRDANVADLVKDGETLEVLVLRQVVGKDTDTVTYLVSKNAWRLAKLGINLLVVKKKLLLLKEHVLLKVVFQLNLKDSVDLFQPQ